MSETSYRSGGCRKRIVLVGPLPPPSGGMANQTRQLERLLVEEGCIVVTVQSNAPYRPTWTGSLRGIRAVVRLVPYVGAVWRASRNCDIVHLMANSGWSWHLCAAPAIWTSRLRGVPIVVNYRGGEAEPFMRAQAAWIRPTLRQARAVVVPSEFLRAVFARFGIEAQVVPNVVDLERFFPGPVREVGKHIVITRNLEDIYDIPTALRAMREIVSHHPDARLTIAGSGPARPRLEKLVLSLGLASSVTFTGRLDNEQVAKLYREADLVLNPSTVDNLPNSLLEAMASGVAIVSTEVGGVSYLLEHERTGLLVPPRDPEAMAAAALRLLGDNALRARLTAASLEEARAYTWARVRSCLFGVYDRCTGMA